MTVAPTTSENEKTALRLGAKGRRVFTIKGWNDCVRRAGIFAGDWWLGNYGPLRWNAAYAQSQLGYRPGKRKRARMQRGESPYFDTGAWAGNFNSRARTQAVAKGGIARFWITVPIGHPVQPQTVASFKTVPAREATAVAREFRRALIQELQAGRAAHAAKQRAKATARAERKAANAAKRAERRASRSTRRQSAFRGAA